MENITYYTIIRVLHFIGMAAWFGTALAVNIIWSKKQTGDVDLVSDGAMPPRPGSLSPGHCCAFHWFQCAPCRGPVGLRSWNLGEDLVGWDVGVSAGSHRPPCPMGALARYSKQNAVGRSPAILARSMTRTSGQ